MPGELLNGPRWRATHRQVRTERMPEAMHAAHSQVRSADRTAHRLADHVVRQRGSIALTEHQGRRKCRMVAECPRQANGQRHVAHAAALRHADMSAPVAALNAELRTMFKKMVIFRYYHADDHGETR